MRDHEAILAGCGHFVELADFDLVVCRDAEAQENCFPILSLDEAPVVHHGVVCFWALNHPRRSEVAWPVSDWAKLVFASEGTIMVESDDHLFVCPPNRAVWVAPGTRHRMTSLGASNVRTLYFHPGYEESRPSRPLHVRPLMKELIVETCRVGPLMQGNRLQAAVFEMLSHEVTTALLAPSYVVLPRGDLACRAARLMLADAERWSQLDELAAEVGCSRRSLERHFQADIGMSLGRWRQQTRLLQSIQVLADRQTVADTAFHSGYSSTSAYIHAFRSHFGMTPSEWRGSN